MEFLNKKYASYYFLENLPLQEVSTRQTKHGRTRKDNTDELEQTKHGRTRTDKTRTHIGQSKYGQKKSFA